MKNINLFSKLLCLDLITKILAHIIEPKNSIFFLTYNKDIIFNLDLGITVKFLLPLMILPVFLLIGLYLKKEQKQTYFQVVMAGFIGNYICRFTDVGVIDFINLGSVVANLADIYCWASYGLFCFYIAQNLNLKERLFKKV